MGKPKNWIKTLWKLRFSAAPLFYEMSFCSRYLLIRKNESSMIMEKIRWIRNSNSEDKILSRADSHSVETALSHSSFTSAELIFYMQIYLPLGLFILFCFLTRCILRVVRVQVLLIDFFEFFSFVCSRHAPVFFGKCKMHLLRLMGRQAVNGDVV